MARKALEDYESSHHKKPLTHKLSEGLDLLDEFIINSKDNEDKIVANTIVATYINKTYQFVIAALENTLITEVELEGLNYALIEIRESAFGVNDEVEKIRNKVLAALMMFYFKSYSPEERKKLIDVILSMDT